MEDKLKALERLASLNRKGPDEAKWNSLAEKVLNLKHDGIKVYNQTGLAARDLYRDALRLEAEALALENKLTSKGFGHAEIESWYSETATLQLQEQVSQAAVAFRVDRRKDGNQRIGISLRRMV
jgi:hypothetical protein